MKRKHPLSKLNFSWTWHLRFIRYGRHYRFRSVSVFRCCNFITTENRMLFWDIDNQENEVVKQKNVNKHSQQHTWDWFHSVLHMEKLPYWYCSMQDAQLLLNKQQQTWGAVYIRWHFSSSTDTAVLPNCDLNQSNLTPKWNYIPRKWQVDVATTIRR